MFDFINIPFAWLLLTLYNFTNSYGLALILFAIITKVLLLYFSARGKKGMMQQQRLQPKQAKLQAQYKDDKQKYQEALNKLYQDEEVSPMSGCLWSLLPFPIMIALYSVIRLPLVNLMKLTTEQIDAVGLKVNELLAASGQAVVNLQGAYSELELAQQVHNFFPQIQQQLGDSASGLIDINFKFLGINLAEIPPWPWDRLSWLILIPILSAGSAYLMSFISQKVSKQPAPQGSARTMLLLSPLLSLWFGFIMPAGMGVYWITNNILGIAQDFVLTRHYTKILDADDARKAELETRRKTAEEEQRRIDREARAERLAAKGDKKSKVYRVQNQPKKKPPSRTDQPPQSEE